MNFQFVDPWHLFLPREGGHVVGISGSGGKTSLLLRIAEYYRATGQPILLTTTTRTEPLPNVTALEWNDFAPDAVLGSVPFLHDGVTGDGKWRGLEAAQVDQLSEQLPGHILLVEVDGAAKKPLKLYSAGEPVWPLRTSLALVVAGLQGMDSKTGEVVHRWGRFEFAPLADVGHDTLWNWEHLLTLLAGPGGYLDQVPAHVPAVLALAGMSQVVDTIGMFEFMGKIMSDERVPLASLCELAGPEPSLRTVCRREDSPGAGA